MHESEKTMAQYTFKKAMNFLKPKDIWNVAACAIVFPFAMLAKIFIRNFWLICEEENEARDNGYWFFRWLRENHPEQKVAYAINKKSPDYRKVCDLGRVLSYGTLEHWFWYLVADKNISAHKGGKPNAAVCYFFEVVLKLRKNNRIFLQHGIIVNMLEWIFYQNTNMRLLVTGAKPEYDFISANFGYPEGYVRLLGLPRFDNLSNSTAEEDLILVMPSWREWIGRPSHDNRDLDFTQTEYFHAWNGLLNSPELANLLEKYQKRLIFFPHHNMQKYLSSFSVENDRIKLAGWKEYDVQDLLKRASFLITDYSSVFFDFSYMGKPVLFYQFDEAEFREKQYQEGYFNYHDNPLGKWADTQKKVLWLLDDMLENNYRPTLEQIDQYFPVRDTNNSKRCYDAIIDIQKSKRR